MKKIKMIHKAAYRPIADLITYSPLPSPHLQQIDPFLFLNHHGHQTYSPDNQGLPFGPHPHRGMETVTFIIEGDIMHKDSQGYQSIIKAGGIQWMTAGSGLIHAEISSEEFKQKGGDLEILQLWLNLPSHLKMTEPAYKGLQSDEIPQIEVAQGVVMQLIAGEWEGVKGAFKPLTDVFLSTLHLQTGSTMSTNVATTRNVFFYVVRGEVVLNHQNIPFRSLVEFATEGEALEIEASKDSLVIFGHATPYQEPVVAQGPFVMNTEQEIRQAYHDYQMGKFGTWKG